MNPENLTKPLQHPYIVTLQTLTDLKIHIIDK